MRQVLSLYLPASITKKMKSLSKKRGHESISSYVKYLVEMDEDLISEKTLLEAIKQARAEYRAGKATTAQSMTDLL